jgi:gas vesicle protein
MTNQSGNWMPGSAFLLGAVAGGVAALFLAPYNGVETRRRLKTGFRDGKSKAMQRSQEMAANIVDRGEQLMDAGKKRIADEARKIDSAIQAGKNAYQQSGVPNQA